MTDQPTTTEPEDEHRRLYERPLARAHALADAWADDPTPIPRSQAAALLGDALATVGWTETEQAGPGLTVVAAPEEAADGV